ncbi:lysine decarboxylase-like protein-like protein [Polychaeton citri CBS 116435]|uniref:Lysine decarboxylase-like protein-like protein n=1 Tax=Polychaeton citri CBS 116435 TaxID=1314669 RepID=A0A9P4QC01_9PEZI|nr:lysine decarboxylase-like protein-like protein [Polychaeton citri CBS 116435]
MTAANPLKEPNSEHTAPSSNGSSKAPVVCVFCGASPGKSPAHLDAARQLGRKLHENGMKLVYGGGTVGIMGEVAKTLVSLSGPEAVHGVIPAALMEFERRFDENGVEVEASKLEAQKLIDEKTFGRTTVVKDMHTRKQMMAREVIDGGPGGGFVALSGGYGTLEELMEVVTWNQLGIHARGIVVFNVEGYWDGLIQWVNKAVDSGFIAGKNKGILVESTTAEDVVEQLKTYKISEARFNLQWEEK